jgi:branched-subunit amino acid aminotransferase/4-amino-4-deoxychorismate lyase
VLVWLNGRFVEAARARVPVLDRGLLHGDGLYETWRTYGGEPFAVAAHLRRLAAAARRLALPVPGDAGVWVRRSRVLVRRNRLPDAAVRLTITRGDTGEAIVPERRAPPTVLLLVRPLPADLARRQRDGVRVVLLPFPRDASATWGGLKLLGHASAVAGRMLAARRRADEGLYVTPTGDVTEGTTSNVFAVFGRSLVTPPLGAGILAGVTRAMVLALARHSRLRVQEAPLRARALARADEVFLTASTVEILPVVRLDGVRIGPGTPGPVTRELQARYRARIAAAQKANARNTA